jgi:hypothetical protein
VDVADIQDAPLATIARDGPGNFNAPFRVANAIERGIDGERKSRSRRKSEVVKPKRAVRKSLDFNQERRKTLVRCPKTVLDNGLDLKTVEAGSVRNREWQDAQGPIGSLARQASGTVKDEDIALRIRDVRCQMELGSGGEVE